MSQLVGTDVGGTFTDLVVIDDDGRLEVIKTPTTPADRVEGVLDALRLASESAEVADVADFLSSVTYLAHGTTAATNAFIERKGAKVALITTKGFADVLRLQRAMASWSGTPSHELSHYSRRSNPTPILSQDLIGEVTERVDYAGRVVVPLDEDDAEVVVGSLLEQDIDAIAISLLWSFRNPAHERTIKAIVERQAPEVFVTASCDLIPVLGEYERTSTTTINAYLGPVIDFYLSRLDGAVKDAGYSGDVAIMDSGGGVLTAAEARSRPAGLLTSGPAGGVLASVRLADELGHRNVVTADMGGTSFDVGLIVDGDAVLDSERVVERFHSGLTAVKVTAIGSGGGSIARVEGGHLTVGPDSAGAEPGPACYARGGSLPTVTDADLVLGVLDPAHFLGGRMTLDTSLSEAAIARHIAEPLGLTVLEAAAGIREVTDNQMADVLTSTTVRVGYDPRDFVLYAYGGAGPTHARGFAAAVGIRQVVVPATATAHSALGCVVAGRRRSFQHTIGAHTPPGRSAVADHVDVAAFTSGFAELEEQCRKALGSEVELQRSVGMRFRLQTHEIPVPMPPGEITPSGLEELVDRFQVVYEKIYGEGTSLRESGIEFTTLRVDGRVPVAHEDLRLVVSHEAAGAEQTSRPVYFYSEQAQIDTAVYEGSSIAPGTSIDGPAILVYPGTTVLVGPDDTATIDDRGNTHLTLASAQ